MLIYIGSGNYIVGIPARDLSEEEVKAYGGADFLLSTGLYAKPDQPAKGSDKKQER